MKRTFYSILLIFLLSCGTTPQERHIVAVHLNSGEIHDGVLLYVRDTSLLLQEQYIPRDSLGSIANIPTSQIHSVELIRPSNWEAPLFGGLFGGLVGCLVGNAIDKGDGSGGGHPNFDGLGGAILGCGAGIGVGIAGGIIVDNIPTTFTPDNKARWQRLRAYAKHTGEEPDELKKIK